MHQIVAAADQEVGGLAVILPPLYEIFWSAVVLLIVLLLVGRYALPRIYQTMDERAAKIEEGLGAAEQAKADQAAAAREREEIIREAHAQAHTIRERANDEAKAIVAAARHEATSEAKISLRSEVGLLASELAEKIIGEQLTDTALTSRVVDRFLDELEADSALVEEKR